MLQNPFADLIPNQPAQPGPITVGTPRPRLPPPQTPTNAALDEEQLEAARLENERRRREAAAAMAQGAEAAQTTAEERRASGFLRRALGANLSYEETGLGPRSFVGEVVNDVNEDILDQFPEPIGNSPARQVADTAQREFIAATLRLDSGAAIPPEEFESQAQIYFPQPGETSPQILAQKREARRRAIESLVTSSGRSVPDDVRQQLEGWLAAFDAQDQENANADQPADPDTPEIVVGEGIDPHTGRPVAEAPTIPPGALERGIGRPLALGVGDVAQGAGDILGIVGNPLNAGVNALLGTDLSVDLGRTMREATGAPDPATRAEQLASAMVRGGTGGLSLAGAARSAAPLATGALSSALSRFGAMPVTDAFTGMTGAGSSDLARQAGAGPVGQIGAGIVGGAAALPIAGRFANMISRPPMQENALLRAGQQEGVDVNRAMIDPEAQQRVTAVDRTMVGGPIVQRGMRQIGDQIEGRVQALGRGGQALDENAAGQTVRRSAERYIKNSGQQARRLYDSAVTASEGVRVPAQRSLQLIDDVTARLRETPETNAAELAFLERLRSDLANDLSVSALRDIRTQLRSRISNGGLTFGQNEATVLGVMDAAAEDITAGLQAAGRGRAAQLFRRADEMYRDRMEFINGTVQRLIGRRNADLPPERVFANFQAMSRPRGDTAGLARMMREMEPEEQADIAATFAQALGRNNRGEFSTSHLISQLERLPRRARVNVFGPEGARSLGNLERLAREHSRVRGAMGGSPTGVANDWRSWLGTLFFGGAPGFAVSGGGAAMATAGAALAAKGGRDVLSARALMSRDVQSWLRNAPKTNDPRAINRHFDRLRVIAARQPALAGEIEQLQQAIMRAANDSFERSAVASEAEDEQRR